MGHQLMGNQVQGRTKENAGPDLKAQRFMTSRESSGGGGPKKDKFCWKDGCEDVNKRRKPSSKRDPDSANVAFREGGKSQKMKKRNKKSKKYCFGNRKETGGGGEKPKVNTLKKVLKRSSPVVIVRRLWVDGASKRSAPCC